MKSFEEIKWEIQRLERERDYYISTDDNILANVQNSKIWALQWALKESQPCDYCKSKSDAKDLLRTKHDQVFIDPDEKKIVWEHTDFFNDMEYPFDPDEVTITVEFEAEFCPKCGARIGGK